MRRRLASFQPVALGVLALACVANLLKAIPDETQRLVWPFWSITYRYGFVRRGLVGTIFHALGGRTDELGVYRVLVVHRVATALLVAAMLAWALRTIAREGAKERVPLAYGIAAVFLSGFVPTVGQNAGYYDVFILLVAVAAAFAATNGALVVAAALAAVGPVIHDAFVFVWMPVLVASWCRGVRARGLPLLAPLAVTVLVQLAHSATAIDRMIDEAADKEALRVAYRLSLRWFADRMVTIFADRPEQLALGLVAFAAPAVVAAAYAARAGRDVRAVVLTTVSPCAILLVAWDLSRFLVWSAFGAYVALVALPRSRTMTARQDDVRGAVLGGALAAIAIAAAGGPHLYAYFHVAYADYTSGPSILRHTPAARLSYAWLRVFNRRLYTTGLASTRASEPCVLEPWDARRGTGADACTFELDDKARVESPLLWLERGVYVARVRLEAAGPADTAPRVRLVARPYGRFAKPAVESAGELHGEAAWFEVAFEVGEADEAVGRQRVIVYGEGGSFRLTDLVVQRR